MSDMIYTNAEIKDKLEPIFKSYGVKRAILFGSYSKGVATSRSDVDIFVDSGLRGLEFYGLLEDVTCTLDKEVDLIDACQVKADSRVLDEINDTGVLIYG
ncbi:MAG: nucleotidyltransferase domain-containing protein [Eubacteriales bacterium]|nr:nucleotidyltransferase domain-containing protein [Eubacteriales bacterium]